AQLRPLHDPKYYSAEDERPCEDTRECNWVTGSGGQLKLILQRRISTSRIVQGIKYLPWRFPSVDRGGNEKERYGRHRSQNDDPAGVDRSAFSGCVSNRIAEADP